MTKVRFYPMDAGKRPLGSTESGVTGYYEVGPYRRYTDSAGTVYEVPIQIPLTGLQVIEDVAVPPAGNALVVRERFPGGANVRYLIFPTPLPTDPDGSVRYEALREVDPQSLAPTAAPEAAWWLALEGLQVGGGDGGIPDGGVIGLQVLAADTPEEVKAAAGLSNVSNLRPGQYPVSVAQAAADNTRLLKTDRNKAGGVAAVNADGQVVDPAGNVLATAATMASALTGTAKFLVWQPSWTVWPPRPAWDVVIAVGGPEIPPWIDTTKGDLWLATKPVGA